MNFLDVRICEEFRDAVNGTNIFARDEEYIDKFNLICAIMDRVDSSVKYLNSNSDTPKNEDSLLFFIVHSCIILDAVKQLLKALDIENIYTDEKNPAAYTYFKNICMGNPLNIPGEKCPTDDKFFEYLRSLSMAHPFKTNRPCFFQQNEIQYSPHLTVDRGLNNSDDVGIMIYSNKFEKTQKNLLYSFNILKEYINSRFILTKEASRKVNQIIADKEKVWKNEKVTREMSSIDTLKHVEKILSTRYRENYLVKEAIESLTCIPTESKNRQAISEFQNAIITLIPDIVQAVDDLDYDQLENTLNNVLNVRPKKMDNFCNYQLGKIFSDLNSGDEALEKYNHAIINVNHFADDFLVKWVKIDTNTMVADEIKLLARVACYLEKQEQESIS